MLLEWVDVILQDHVEWVTDSEILAGTCDHAVSLKRVVVHEVGHLLGLAHPCEEGEVCADPAMADALMYWTVPWCDSDVLARPDDVQGAWALYGPGLEVTCSRQVGDVALGAVPFELACVATARDPRHVLDDVTWNFGDGSPEVTGTAAAHVYTRPGSYGVTVQAHGTAPDCGDGGFEIRVEHPDLVRACGIPQVSFELEQVDRLTYQVHNWTDLSVYGCVQNTAWAVYAGETATGTPIQTSQAWEPLLILPERGDYTVVANVGGLAGTGAAEVTFRARRARPGHGCNAAPGPTRSAPLLVLSWFVAIGRIRGRSVNGRWKIPT